MRRGECRLKRRLARRSEIQGILFDRGNWPARQLGNVSRKPIKGHRLLVRFPREFVFGNAFQCLPGGCHLLVELWNQQVAEFHRALLFHSSRVLSSLYCLMLIISNEDIESVLTLDVAFKALERAYLDQASGRAVNRPRSDLYLPAVHDCSIYALKSMEVGLVESKVVALRLNSDVIRWEDRENRVIKQKVPA